MKNRQDWEMGSALIRLRELMRLNFLENSDNLKSTLYQSVFIEVLIHLNYLLTRWKENKLEPEISQYDDIDNYKTLENGGYNDIISLVRYFRNAACHAESNKREVRNPMPKKDEPQIIAFIFQSGDGKSVKTGLHNYCKYEDDTAALMGDHVLYIKRHLIKAYQEIYDNMLSLPRFGAYKQLIQFRIDAGR